MKALVSEEHNCVLVSCGMCLLMHVFLDDSLFFSVIHLHKLAVCHCLMMALTSFADFWRDLLD